MGSSELHRPSLRRVLNLLGYSDDLIFGEYQVWAGRRHVVRADLVAFAALPADMRTAAVVCETKTHFTDASIRAAQSLASPIALLVEGERLKFYALAAGRSRPEEMTGWIQADDESEFRRLRRELGPDPILRFKRGEQASLFPLDVSLLSSASNRLGSDLHARVSGTLEALSDELRESDGRLSLQRSSRLLVGGLACLMIRDKGELDVSPSSLTDIALQRYPRYFSWLVEAPSSESELLVPTIERLGGDITYTGLSPGIVSDVYETALVEEDDRRELGIYYTPPQLAAKILGSLPFEEIEPPARRVLDPTCGSGTLLLAAYDRLEALSDKSAFTAAQRHESISRSLHGWDSDPFAVQITQLALLLHDMPQGNGWNIAVRDALDLQPDTIRPTIAVSNPPWLLDAQAYQGFRGERANAHIVSLIDELQDGGLLAVLLPAAWLTSTYSSSTQQYLRDQTDVFEVWRLPEDTFRSARVPTAVLYARKRPGTPSASWTAFRRVFPNKSGLERLYRDGEADESILIPPGAPLVSGGLTASLAAAPNLLRLDSFCDIAFGPQLFSDAGKRSENDQMWLSEFRAVPSFKEPPPSLLKPVKYPDDFRRKMPLARAAAPKVLALATRWTENPWRLRVAVDLKGIVVRNSILMVRPMTLPLTDEPALFALMALLSSGIASVWIDEHAAKRSIRVEDLRSLPVPSSISWELLAAIGTRLHAADSSEDVAATLAELERYVWDKYAVDDVLRDRVISRLSQYNSSRGVNRFASGAVVVADSSELTRSSASSSSSWTPGAVMEIAGGLMRLWVSGVTELDGIWMPMPTRFPGALCYEGATFEVNADSIDRISSSNYRFHDDAWVSDDALFGPIG